MNSDDIAYFTRRVDEERRRAAGETSTEIAGIHRRFAAHYEQALAALSPAADPGLAWTETAGDR